MTWTIIFVKTALTDLPVSAWHPREQVDVTTYANRELQDNDNNHCIFLALYYILEEYWISDINIPKLYT